MPDGLEGVSIAINQTETQLFAPTAGFQGIAVEQDLRPKQVFQRALGLMGLVIEISPDGHAHKIVKNSF